MPLFIPAIFFSSVSARACLSCRFCVGWTLAFVFEPTLLIWEPWIAWRTTTSHSYRYANELQPGFSSGPCTCRPYTTSKGRRQIGGASPVCSDLSRFKNAADGGPKPIRTAEFPEGLPDLTESEQQRLATSKLLLERCVALLDAVFRAGGHVSLEQPRDALSLLCHEVQEFLKRISADLNVVPACSVGVSVHKHWLFASSWRPLQSLAEHTDERCAKMRTATGCPSLQLPFQSSCASASLLLCMASSILLQGAASSQ